MIFLSGWCFVEWDTHQNCHQGLCPRLYAGVPLRDANSVGPGESGGRGSGRGGEVSLKELAKQFGGTALIILLSHVSAAKLQSSVTA